MTFDEWLDEIEGFATRLERLETEVDFAAVMTGNLSHNLARRRMYKWLEAAYNEGVKHATQAPPAPMIPTIPSYPPNPLSPYNRCVTCGLHLGGVMGYVCSHPQCPTSAQVGSAVQMLNETSITNKDLN